MYEGGLIKLNSTHSTFDFVSDARKLPNGKGYASMRYPFLQILLSYEQVKGFLAHFSFKYLIVTARAICYSHPRKVANEGQCFAYKIIPHFK